MHSLKTTCAGPIFALAKPHDSVGKRTRSRIPKEERKTLVESFIKKHQNLHNGSFPSISLTQEEVGGSFYTIREIVREIIQENRVLGPGEFILEGKGSDHSQDQSLSSSIPMDPVPPLSLSPGGASDQSCNFSSEAGDTNSPEKMENTNGSLAAPEDRGSNILNCEDLNAAPQLFGEEIELLEHQSMSSTDISRTQVAASFTEENDTKHDKVLEVDDKDMGFEEIPFMESEGTKPVNNDERVSDDGAAMTEMVSMTKKSLSIIDLPAGIETFPVRSVSSTMESSEVQPSELDKLCDDMKGTETKVENDSSTITTVDFGEISSPASTVTEEKRTEVIVEQMPNHISVIEEKTVNPASIVVEYADTKGTVVENGSIHETKEFSNGALTTKQKMPTSGTEQSESSKNVIAKLDAMSNTARNEVAIVEEKATMEKEKLDCSDSSSSQEGNNATLNRIKPESWKGESKKAGHETNPLLAVLKSFLTAFVKFWSQ